MFLTSVLCHILVGKNQKNKYFPSPLLRYCNFKIWRPLTLLRSGGGPRWPKAQEIACRFQMSRDTELSFGDFSSWSFFQPLVKPLLKFFLWNIEKLTCEDNWSPSFSRRKWEKWNFFSFFSIKSYFFCCGFEFYIISAFIWGISCISS